MAREHHVDCVRTAERYVCTRKCNSSIDSIENEICHAFSCSCPSTRIVGTSVWMAVWKVVDVLFSCAVPVANVPYSVVVEWIWLTRDEEKNNFIWTSSVLFLVLHLVPSHQEAMEHPQGDENWAERHPARKMNEASSIKMIELTTFHSSLGCWF